MRWQVAVVLTTVGWIALIVAVSVIFFPACARAGYTAGVLGAPGTGREVRWLKKWIFMAAAAAACSSASGTAGPADGAGDGAGGRMMRAPGSAVLGGAEGEDAAPRPPGPGPDALAPRPLDGAGAGLTDAATSPPAADAAAPPKLDAAGSWAPVVLVNGNIRYPDCSGASGGSYCPGVRNRDGYQCFTCPNAKPLPCFVSRMPGQCGPGSTAQFPPRVCVASCAECEPAPSSCPADGGAL